MALSEKDLSEGQGRPPDQTGEDREFLDYVLILFRYRWLIFWTVSLCTAGIVTYASVQEPEFQATAAIHSKQRDHSISVLSSEVTRRNVVRKLYQYERDGETHVVDLTEILGAGSEQRAVQALQGMVRFLDSPDQQYVTSIIVTSTSPWLSKIVANAYVVQLLQDEYDNLKERRSHLTGKDLANIKKIDSVTDKFEKFQKNMDKVGVKVFQGFQIGNVEVRSLAVSAETQIERYGMKKALAVGLATGLFISVPLFFFFEYLRRKRQAGLLEPLTDELRKDVKWVRGLFERR